MSKLRQALKKDNLKEDLIVKGFHKLDDNLVDYKAPKIGWGMIYQDSTDREKIEYLEKLCATMNHAAYLIQEERNGLLKDMDIKNVQMAEARKAMKDNLDILQHEVTEMNTYKQNVNKSMGEKNQKIVDLKKDIRLLEKKLKNGV